MGCGGSKDAVPQQPQVYPNLYQGAGEGLSSKDSGEFAKELAKESGKGASKGSGSKRLSMSYTGPDTTGPTLPLPGTQRHSGALSDALMESDIIVMLDSSATLPSTGGGRKNRRGSVCIGSTIDDNTTNSFKDKALDKQGDTSALEASTIAYSCRKGLKPTSPNQDSFCIIKTPGFSIYGVFDGHGVHGHLVSNFVKVVLPKLLVQDENFGQAAERPQAMKNAFVQTHQLIEAESRKKNPQFNADLAGCTTTLVLHDHVTSTLLVAHVGDSTCCLGKKATLTDCSETISAEKLTEDHKPELPEEKLRIEEAGGVVQFDGYVTHRVYAKDKQYPGMAMSRALGDVLGHKEAGIIAEPTVKEIQLGDGDQLLLLCSDGVWEFITPQEAMETVFVAEKLQDGIDSLVQMSWDRWIKEEGGEVVDDITAIVVVLPDGKYSSEGSSQDNTMSKEAHPEGLPKFSGVSQSS